MFGTDQSKSNYQKTMIKGLGICTNKLNLDDMDYLIECIDYA